MFWFFAAILATIEVLFALCLLLLATGAIIALFMWLEAALGSWGLLAGMLVILGTMVLLLASLAFWERVKEIRVDLRRKRTNGGA